jgi:hypothetical protein
MHWTSPNVCPIRRALRAITSVPCIHPSPNGSALAPTLHVSNAIQWPVRRTWNDRPDAAQFSGAGHQTRSLSHVWTRPWGLRTYRRVGQQTNEGMRVAGATSLFEVRVFKDLCFVARAIAQEFEG